MLIYAEFTEQPEGALRGLHHLSEGDAREGWVPISEDQWRDLAVNQSFRRWNGSEIVEYVPPPAAPIGRTAKADIWRRASDAEAAKIMAGLDALPLRKRQIYNDATYLDHGDPLFADLKAGFKVAFGEARASVLLAVSE